MIRVGRRSRALLPVFAALLLSIAHPAAAQYGADAASGSAAAADGVPKMTNRVGPGGATRPTPAPAAPAPGQAQPPAAPSDVILLSPVTPVAPSVNVHDKVLEECHLQTLLPERIASRHRRVALSDGVGPRRLELKIVDVHAPSGGFFSGPKWMTVEGRLLEGKAVRGTFVAKETSMAATNACGMLDKVVFVLAGDIATWLDNPKKGSKLGRAR